MSKQGRSSIVLLGWVVSVLILIPLVYHAFAARIDQNALTRRIAVLQATAVDGPAALQVRYRDVCERMLPILPPDPEMRVNHSAGTVVFDPLDFADWIDDLEPTELNGVTVYPVTVAEDPETRDTVFYNGLAAPVAVIAPEQDYDPFAWLAAHRPELYAENAVPAVRAKAEALFDPARVCVTFYLLPVENVSAMAEAQLAAVQQLEVPMNMMMGEGLLEPVTNLVIFAMEKVTNGMALGIGWPDDFTNKLEVFARTNIAPIGWFVTSTNLSTTGTNSLWWTDTSVSSLPSRFYRVGNADLDGDEDGLTDARERFVYGTDEGASDSDGDGFTDFQEIIEMNTDPNNNDTNKPAVTIIFPPNNGSWVWVP